MNRVTLQSTRPPTPTDARWFVGTLVRIVAGAAETGGSMMVMEQRARRGFSPPRHVHRNEDTALWVRSGRLTVEIGDRTEVVTDGGFVWLPRDVPHTFRVDSDEVDLVELATPGGIEGFHVDASDPAADAGLPPDDAPDVARLVAATAPYAVEIIGPPMS
jgi:quercetin dioxygenase-like cupin family protein